MELNAQNAQKHTTSDMTADAFKSIPSAKLTTNKVNVSPVSTDTLLTKETVLKLPRKWIPTVAGLRELNVWDALGDTDSILKESASN